MSTPKSKVSIDTPELLAALARSTNMARVLDDVARSVGERAAAIAGAEAYDTGDYQRGFSSQGIAATTLRAWLRSRQAQEYRARRKAVGAFSPALEGDYRGSVGLIANTDYKAALIEFGTVRMAPRNVLRRAALEHGGEVGQR